MIRILCLCAALIFSSMASAKNVPVRKSEPFPKLLTSRQLLALTPARRMAYFLKIRKLLRELAAMNHRGHGTLIGLEAAEDGELYAHLLNYLDTMGRLLVPQAAAANCDSQYPFDLGPLCGVPCAGRDTRPDETGQAINNYYFCFPRDKFYSWYDKPEATRPSLQITPNAKARLQLADKEQLPTYAPERDIPPPKQIEAIPVTPEPSEVIAGNSDGDRLKPSDSKVEEIKAVDMPAATPVVTGTTPEGGAVTATDWPKTCHSSKPPQGDLMYSECSQSWVNKEILDGQEAAIKREAAAEKEKDATELTAGKIAETAPPSAVACPAPQFACGEKERNNYRSKQRSGALDKFRKGAPKSCIYGGNMSAYRNNEVKPGNCADVSEFCAQKEKCKGKSEDAEGGFKTKYACEKGKTLCQPFIFGLSNRSTPICVPKKGSDITEKCDAAAKKASGPAAYVGDLLNSKLSGAAEAWDEYADNFNKVCEDGTDSQAAHCEECAIIGKRLAEANFMATGKCNKALKSSEIKLKGSQDEPATER